MCTPLAAGSALVGGAQTVSSIVGQRQQAQMQEQLKVSQMMQLCFKSQMA